MRWLKLRYKRLIIYGFSYILLMLFFVFPLNYELLLPGGVNDASNFIKIENAHEINGSFNRSYVSVVTRPSIFQYLISLNNPRIDIIELSEQQSQLSHLEMNYKSNLYKRSSIYHALIAAYNEAEKELIYQEKGVVLIDRILNSPAYEKLAIGDIIIKIDGIDVNNYHDLNNLLIDYDCAEPFTMTILRDDKEMEIEIEKELYNNERCILGLHQSYTYTNYVFDFKNSNPGIISVNYSGLGPSAGLMQALTIYNMITPNDITYGLKIAGTGTIDEEGNVGPIGGIKQKVFGACKGNVDIFFTPYDHLEEAIKARDIMKSKMKIVPVATLQEAIKYLRDNYE